MSGDICITPLPATHAVNDTEQALTCFQQNQGLLVTGMADAVTMKALETAERHAGDYVRYDVYEDYEYEAAESGAYYAAVPASTAMPAMDTEADSRMLETLKTTAPSTTQPILAQSACARS